MAEKDRLLKEYADTYSGLVRLLSAGRCFDEAIDILSEGSDREHILDILKDCIMGKEQ